MSEKKLRSEHQSDIKSQDIVSEEQVISSERSPLPSKKKKSHLKILVLLLGLAALACFAVYYYNLSKGPLSNEILLSKPDFDSSFTEEMELMEKGIENNTEISNEEQVELEAVETYEPPKAESIIISYEDRLIPLEEAPIRFVPPDPTKTEKLGKPNPEVILLIMELKDAFKIPGKCRPLLEELMKLPNKTPEVEQALAQLLPVCLERSLHDQMKEAFYNSKRKAIFRVFQQEYPLYMAYLKIIPYYLADIHKKNPTDNTPLDILDKIQNAIDTDHPIEVITLISSLPTNVQVSLYDVYQFALAEKDLYATITHLTKSLLNQGVHND